MNMLEAKFVMNSLGNLDQKLPREENAKTVNLPAFRELVEATRNIPGTEPYRAKVEQHPLLQSKVAAAPVTEQSRQLIRDAVTFRGFLKTIQTFLSAFTSVSATESDIYVRFSKADDLPGLNQQMSTFQKILE